MIVKQINCYNHSKCIGVHKDMDKEQELFTSHEYYKYIELITNCFASPDHNSIINIINWAKEKVESDTVIACIVRNEISQVDVIKVIEHSYPEAWVNDYLDNNYATLDPVLNHALLSINHIYWEDVLGCQNFDVSTSRFIENAQDNGLHAGITRSYKNIEHDTSESLIISFSNIQKKRESQAEYILRTLPSVLYNATKKMYKKNKQEIILTDKEIIVLRLAMTGKKVIDIGELSNISENTVKFHLRNIYRKLSVNNRAHAISRAINLGIIS